MTIETHAPPGDFDYIAVIGGGLEHLHLGHRGDRAFLTDAYHNNVPLIGIGTGSFILAEEGLLNERRASIHPHHHDVFTQRFPQVSLQRVELLQDEQVQQWLRSHSLWELE